MLHSYKLIFSAKIESKILKLYSFELFQLLSGAIIKGR